MAENSKLAALFVFNASKNCAGFNLDLDPSWLHKQLIVYHLESRVRVTTRVLIKIFGFVSENFVVRRLLKSVFFPVVQQHTQSIVHFLIKVPKLVPM